MGKQRLDLLLVERGLVDNQEEAKRFIMAGTVFSEQLRLDKPGLKVDDSISLTIKRKSIPYVGRGGLKLEKALTFFDIDLQNKIMVDVGSSTGGFTDCALQNGVKLSYAIDVGYNQLDWKLRNDERVIVMERTNFRYVTPDMLTNETPNLAAVDVSFISLTLILPVLKTLLSENSDIIILIKPQFEAGKEKVEKGGIVRNPKTHIEVIKSILAFAKKENFQFYDLTYSPITGGEGNIEYLVHLGWKHDRSEANIHENYIENIVLEAHQHLVKGN